MIRGTIHVSFSLLSLSLHLLGNEELLHSIPEFSSTYCCNRYGNSEKTGEDFLIELSN